MKRAPHREDGFILMIVVLVLLIAAAAAFAFLRVQGAEQ
jgi:hypothetical protein